METSYYRRFTFLHNPEHDPDWGNPIDTTSMEELFPFPFPVVPTVG